jgi:hypothetical protein
MLSTLLDSNTPMYPKKQFPHLLPLNNPFIQVHQTVCKNVSTENSTSSTYVQPEANALQEVSSQPNGRRTKTRRIHNCRIARLLRGRAARSRSRATRGGACARCAARRARTAGSRRDGGRQVGNGDAGALAELRNSRDDFYSAVSGLSGAKSEGRHRTGNFVGGAAVGHARRDGGGDAVAASGALALGVGQGAAGSGNGSGEAGDLWVVVSILVEGLGA